MVEIGKRLRTLRESIQVSQAKMAEILGTSQPAINRFEKGQAAPSVEIMRKYADYFDVSMDYIYARCEAPQGKLYEFRPKITADKPEIKRFVEMCFDPESPMNEKLKAALIQMLEGGSSK